MFVYLEVTISEKQKKAPTYNSEKELWKAGSSTLVLTC